MIPKPFCVEKRKFGIVLMKGKIHQNFVFTPDFFPLEGLIETSYKFWLLACINSCYFSPLYFLAANFNTSTFLF